MPVWNDDCVRELAGAGAIRYITLDTNVFVEKAFRLEAEPLASLGQFNDSFYGFVLSDTVLSEVRRRMNADAADIKSTFDSALKKVLGTFNIALPRRKEIEAFIFRGFQPEFATEKRIDTFVSKSACIVLEDAQWADVRSVMNSYFALAAPFSMQKKEEFPDAFALSSLSEFSKSKKLGVIVVTKDSDWIDYCNLSDGLYATNSLELALNLLSGADAGFSTFLSSISGDARHPFVIAIREAVEEAIYDALVDVDVHSSARVDGEVYNTEIDEIRMPDSNGYLVIEQKRENEFIASLSLSYVVTFSVSFDFYVWDSVDHEEVHINSYASDKTTGSDCQVLLHLRRNKEEFELLSVEAEPLSLNLDFGEVDPF